MESCKIAAIAVKRQEMTLAKETAIAILKIEYPRGITVILGAINHIALTVSDLSASRNFYQPILSFLDYTSLNTFPTFDLWNSPSTGATLTFWQAKPDLIDRQHFDYAPGLHRLAFTATSRQQVDDFYQLLLKLNAHIVDVPTEYDYSPGYYTVFFRDLDNIRIEFVYIPSSQSH